MDVPKIPRRAVDQVAAVLDSPEIARLIRTLEAVRWTGRKGYGPKAMIGMCLIKSVYCLPTWSRTARLVAEHEALQRLLGCAPSQAACYRFAKMLRIRDGWTITQCLNDIIAALHERFPGMGENIAIDGSNIPAHANGHTKGEGKGRYGPRKSSDPDASWGHRSAVSTHRAGGFFGYKIHAAVCVDTDLPIAWTVGTAKTWEPHFAEPLLDAVQARGFPVKTAIMDKIYDLQPVHSACMRRGILPVTPLKETGAVKKGAGAPPECEHGTWTFAGTDFKRKATKWRCPTSECDPRSVWIPATRYHPLIPRESKRFKQLYAQRGAIEREFGRLKTEWALTPIRVRRLERVKLHADLTILARLACRLAQDRALPLAA